MTNAELTRLAVQVATEAGRFARDTRRAGITVASTKTSEVDIVTAADTATESLLIEALLAARPHDGVLGEEGGLRPGTSGLTWVLDPIDGTVNYLYGAGPYAVSVAVVEGEPNPAGWSPLAGCVHDPVGERCYSAGRGDGAFCNGRRLPGPNLVGLQNALLATGFGYLAGRRRRQGRVLAALIADLRDIRRSGCASLDLCSVAVGLVDGYYERGLNPWDHAAGALVASEAGAVVSGPQGRLPGVDLVVAAGQRLHAELLARLDELDAAADD